MRKILFAACACFALSGCATEDQARSVAMKSSQDHCASEGKTFVYGRTSSAPGAIPGLVTEVSVSGYCMTPVEYAAYEKAK